MINKVLFSSESDEYETPQYLFDYYNNIYHFNLDVCASRDNHKCNLYYDKNENGLLKTWHGYSVWCNPPYSNIYKWVQKCYFENLMNNVNIVLLIPARTDTKYFHEYIYNKHEIKFIKGRLKFNNMKTAAPFPSMIVIFHSR